MTKSCLSSGKSAIDNQNAEENSIAIKRLMRGHFATRGRITHC